MSRPNYNRWSNQDLKKAVDLWEEGSTYQEIADSLGRTLSSLKHFINRNRASFPPRKQSRFNKHKSLNLLLTTYLYKAVKAEANRRNISIAMVISDALRNDLLRNKNKAGCD